MRELVDREVAAVHCQNLPDSRIGVDIGERLIDILGEDVASLLVGALTGWPHLKQLSRVADQPEDGQGNAGILPRTHPSVIPKLCECLADDEIRNRYLRMLSSSSDDLAGCPGMMAIPSIGRCNQQPAVSENGQRRRPSYRP